jgi:hypothetical protein
MITTIRCGALCAALTLFPMPAAGADTGTVAELFDCTFKDGKAWADWERVTASHFDTVRAIGGDVANLTTYIWRPFRGDAEVDYVWAAYGAHVRGLANAWSGYYGSGRSEAVDRQWEEIESCQSRVISVEQIFDSPDYPAAGAGREGFAEVYRCQLRPGKTLTDLRAAISVWHDHVQRLGIPFDVYLHLPLISEQDDDHGYLVAHGSMAAFGTNASRYLTHPDTAALTTMLAEVQRCRTSLWRTELIYRPE